MPDGTYAPQSPDLSSFLTSTTPKKKPQTSSYTPRSPSLPAFTPTSPYHLQQQQNPVLSRAYQPPPQHQFQPYNDYSEYSTNSQFSRQYLPPIPDLPSSHAFPPNQIQSPFQPQSLPLPHTQYRSDPSADADADADAEADLEYEPSPTTIGRPDMSTRSKRGGVKSENGAVSGHSEGLGPSQGIDIKTKFPVARIKRIMQADEEVGKVAQVTPVAVSKALELFMISLVTKSMAIARSSNSKRVTAQHLKRAIESDEQFDFLGEIVSRVVEGPEAGGKRVKSEDGSEDEDGEKAAGSRPVKKTKGRRKKGE